MLRTVHSSVAHHHHSVEYFFKKNVAPIAKFYSIMSQPNTTTTELMLRLNSMPENIDKVEPFMQKVKRLYQIDDCTYFNMLLVLTEAVNNSILHGNGADPTKKVSVKFSSGMKTLNFEVSDEGGGFDPATLPDPTDPARLSCPNGRGVYLMHHLSHQLNYSDKGRKVEIQFKLSEMDR